MTDTKGEKNISWKEPAEYRLMLKRAALDRGMHVNEMLRAAVESYLSGPLPNPIPADTLSADERRILGVYRKARLATDPAQQATLDSALKTLVLVAQAVVERSDAGSVKRAAKERHQRGKGDK